MSKTIKLSQLRQIVGTLNPLGPMAAVKAFSGDFAVIVPDEIPHGYEELLEACETLNIQVVYGSQAADNKMMQTVYDELKTALEARTSWGRNQILDLLENVFENLGVKL